MAQVCSGGTSHRAHWVEGAKGLTCTQCHLPVGDGEGGPGPERWRRSTSLPRPAVTTRAYDLANNWLFAIWILAGISATLAFFVYGSSAIHSSSAGRFNFGYAFVAACLALLFWVPWIGVFTVLRAGYAQR